MIEHALVNLIQNSIHATGKSQDATLIIRTSPDNGHIRIQVEDNGCGIPEQVLDRIYEPSFTLKGSRDTTGSYAADVKGTGYGMANVKRYVELHKGEIAVESEQGRGTKVEIRLPVIRKELSETEAVQIRNNTSCSGKRILLVEDEQDISNVQYRVLTNEPCRHRVDVASNGRMAVDLFDRNDYDLVSLDYVLPDETSGLDVYRHIRQIDAEIPILFKSGNLEFLASVKELKQNDPFIDHLSKPCQNKTYIDTIHQLLDSSAKESARFKYQGD
jgi:CheY-like chemotaxis protein